MPDKNQTASLDPSIDPTYGCVIYDPVWFILASADRSGDTSLNIEYGNVHSDSGPKTLPAQLNGYPAMAVLNGTVYLTHQSAGTDHALCYMTYDGTNWSADTTVPHVFLNQSPGMAVFNGNLYVAHQGSDTTESTYSLWYTITNGRVWSKDYNLPGVEMIGSPALAVFNDSLYIFHTGTDDFSTIWYKTTSDGKNWSQGERKVPDTSVRTSPSAAVLGDELYVAYQSKDDGEIYYAKSSDGGSWSKPTMVQGPPATNYPIIPQGSPTLYLDTTNNYLMVVYPSGEGEWIASSVVPQAAG